MLCAWLSNSLLSDEGLWRRLLTASAFSTQFGDTEASRSKSARFCHERGSSSKSRIGVMLDVDEGRLLGAAGGAALTAAGVLAAKGTLTSLSASTLPRALR